MKIAVAKSYGNDLTSRYIARQLRWEIDSCSGICEIDLTGVETLSEAFADEAFATLFIVRGGQWFRNTVRFVNSSEELMGLILDAILERVVLTAV